MHLLKFDTEGNLSLTAFVGDRIPAYAILSHRWEAAGQEVTFQDLKDGKGSDKVGYRKIQFCGEKAKLDGLQYFWVDCCCIDRSSSADLSEAINSMFRWYRNAVKCYVYLSDVSTESVDHLAHSYRPLDESEFRKSNWFTRGWTLQELLAPTSVEFFSREGRRLGDKTSLEHQIHEITGISVHALKGDSLSSFSIEERMSWARKRKTTIEEDQAYCLLGIFGIHFPLIYGEGMKNAFSRLRQEIERSLNINGNGTIKSKETKFEVWGQDERECLRALRTSEYEQFKERNPDRLEQTCQWFLKHGHFEKWQQSDSSSLLWLSADPGCGKSVLAKSLIDKELKSTTSRVTSYYFFKNDNDKQKSVTTALSALLHQIFCQRKSLIQHALPDYEAEGKQLNQSFHKLWSILIKAISDQEAGEVICILDALDECEGPGRYDIIQALVSFYKTVLYDQNRSKLKFLVTSRPYFDIERRFSELTFRAPTIRLKGENESEAISNEINIVTKWRITNLRSQLDLSDSELSDFEKEVLGMTHRTYLWLKLIFTVICNELSPTTKKLKQIVNTLPSTVDEAYESILSKSWKKERAQKLLSIIVAATRPLTLNEMNIALAIEHHHRAYEDLDLEKEARFEITVRNLCGLFVSVIDQKIYLIHQTAKEFLTAKSQGIASGWKHSVDPVASELLMARICITYLMFTVFSVEMVNGTSGHAFFNYAACFWADHYRKIETRAGEDIFKMVLELCETRNPRFQNWFQIYWDLSHSESVNPQFTSTLMVASYLGHHTVVKSLLESNEVDINSQSEDGYGRTPLSWAAERGHATVVELLVQLGKADINAEDSYSNRTPLSWATGNGHDHVVRLLLEKNSIEPDLKDEVYGQTPLSHAAANGHEVVVGLLLEIGGIDVNSKDDHYGQTPLSYAAANGHDAVVKLLLEEEKVDANLKDDYGQTPLSYAAANGHEAVVKLLLEKGDVDADLGDDENATPLLWAERNGHWAIVKLLQSFTTSHQT